MIDPEEWLVVIDRQKVFAECEWSDWACPDHAFQKTDEAFAALARAYGDRVVYTRYVAPDKATDAWVGYFEMWPQFLVAPDDPMYDLTDDTAALAEGHPVVTRATFGKWGSRIGAGDRRRPQDCPVRRGHRLLRADDGARRRGRRRRRPAGRRRLRGQFPGEP